METDDRPAPGTTPPGVGKLTGGQKWLIVGLLVLQVPAGVVFLPLAALFALTGIGVPLSIVFVGVGTMPASVAMRRKAAWRSAAG